jgi:hypothetical protein
VRMGGRSKRLRTVSQSFPLLPTCSQQVSRLFLFSLDHTQTHTTVRRTPLDEGSARRGDLYLTTQTLYKTNIHAVGGIRTHDPRKRSAADLRLRTRRHWDRRLRTVLSEFCVACVEHSAYTVIE